MGNKQQFLLNYIRSLLLEDLSILLFHKIAGTLDLLTKLLLPITLKVDRQQQIGSSEE